MLVMGKALGCLLAGAAVLLIGGVLLVGLLVFSSAGSAAPPPAGAVYGGDNAVTFAAKEMAAHLNSDCLTTNRTPDCVGDASYDAGFPHDILAWGASTCPGCIPWMNNHFQCVSFVLGAYGLFHPLDFSGNGNQFAALYASAHAATLGYQERLPAHGELPVSPGDIMAWSGGKLGHVSIVLGWIAPAPGHNGSLTFAQANGKLPVQTLPILPDGTIATHDGYWNGFSVVAYIYPAFLPVVPGSMATSPSTPGNLPNSPYVALARSDAIAAGIDPTVYLRQINQESGFNPNAVSPAGAIGIAQFLPTTAASLGIDPHDPVVSLQAAAQLMASYVGQYGSYAEALAAYNAGSGAVDEALHACGTGWLACLPQETQMYVTTILGS